MTHTSRRSVLAAAAIVLSGCTPVTPPAPGPTPVNPSAANALATIEGTEAIAMAAITVACGAKLLTQADCDAATAANTAFLAVASGIGADIAAGKPITATDVADALASVLAAVVSLHAKAIAAKKSSATAPAK